MSEEGLPDFVRRLTELGGEGLSGLLNRVLALDPDAAPRLQHLEGKTLLLELTGTGQSVAVTIDDAQLRIEPIADGTDPDEQAAKPDTTVRGRPGDLFAAALPEWGSSKSGVSIQGDTGLARDLQKLFQTLNPDWEAPLTRLFGDVIGHQAAEIFRAGKDWANHAANASRQAAGDYLRHENDSLVQSSEFEHFSTEVERLRDAVDRAEARVRLLQPQAGP